MLSVLDQCELLAVMDNRVQSDGKWIAYTSDRNGHCDLFRKPSDGSGVEELLLTDEQMTVATD
jgi:Tol biopolymer transport system component